MQKERDEEAKEGKFQDKEQYVTTAYKQKLLEMEKEAEEERRKAALEGKFCSGNMPPLFIYRL